MGTRREFVGVDGLRLRVFVCDGRVDENRLSLLLIHGAGGNYLNWPPKIRRMEGVKVAALDLPGHGDSEGDGFDTVQAYAECVDSAVDEMGLERIVLVGHSLGGAIALELAQRRPDLVLGVCLVACGDRFCIPPEWDAAIKTDWDAAVDAIAEGMIGRRTPSDVLAMTKRGLDEVGADALARDFTACRTFEAENIVHDLDSPVEIVAGSVDQLVPLESCRRLHSLLPSSNLRVLHGEGHLFLWDRMTEVRQAIEDLIGRIEQH